MLGSSIQILTTPDEFVFVQPLKFIVLLVRYKADKNVAWRENIKNELPKESGDIHRNNLGKSPEEPVTKVRCHLIPFFKENGITISYKDQ